MDAAHFQAEKQDFAFKPLNVSRVITNGFCCGAVQNTYSYELLK